MSEALKRELSPVARQFFVNGCLLDISPFGSGHINETYQSQFTMSNGVVSYIHQRINHHVFKEPEKVMENIERVTRYAREKIIANGGDPERETLNIVPTIDGKSYYVDEDGNYWRTYHQIKGARTYELVEDPRHVQNASKAFGSFQKLLDDLPGGRLHETIAYFHHTPRRFEAFTQAVERDVKNRAHAVQAEIEFVQRRQAEMSIVVDGLASGCIPERITHNDTKLNNVMIDDATGEGICVIDLDTVMPGSALYDFGDSVRIGASTATEDERDLSIVNLDLEMFDRLACGYLEATCDFLTPAEKDLLAFSARLLSLECGMRFLSDHLSGDVYFRIHRENHNLDRCRTQFKMVAEMERRMEQMEAIIRQYCA